MVTNTLQYPSLGTQEYTVNFINLLGTSLAYTKDFLYELLSGNFSGNGVRRRRPRRVSLPIGSRIWVLSQNTDDYEYSDDMWIVDGEFTIRRPITIEPNQYEFDDFGNILAVYRDRYFIIADRHEYSDFFEFV